MSERDLADATEILPNRLYWVALHTAPRASPKVHFFSVDHEFIYEPFFADFGPLNLSMVWRFCKLLEVKLTDTSLAEKRIIYYCSHDPKKRANAATLMCAFQVIVLGKTGEEVWDVMFGLIIWWQNAFSSYNTSLGIASTCQEDIDLLAACSKTQSGSLDEAPFVASDRS
ncbi:unnamed protein product [Durusdinium trenchii]|uniref:Dual specificity/tyrosine protein phosphatase N-terminal domain-containing protein n=1 Tax=Durusdinium trenchii TaxID=1381693 RepID=A0ABP0QC77_9DINO